MSLSLWRFARSGFSFSDSQILQRWAAPRAALSFLAFMQVIHASQGAAESHPGPKPKVAALFDSPAGKFTRSDRFPSRVAHLRFRTAMQRKIASQRTVSKKFFLKLFPRPQEWVSRASLLRRMW